MLAPIIKLMPAAIEKNAVAEEMSRMMGRDLKTHITVRAGPCQGIVIFLYRTNRIFQSIDLRTPINSLPLPRNHYSKQKQNYVESKYIL